MSVTPIGVVHREIQLKKDTAIFLMEYVKAIPYLLNIDFVPYPVLIPRSFFEISCNVSHEAISYRLRKNLLPKPINFNNGKQQFFSSCLWLHGFFIASDWIAGHLYTVEKNRGKRIDWFKTNFLDQEFNLRLFDFAVLFYCALHNEGELLCRFSMWPRYYCRKIIASWP